MVKVKASTCRKHTELNAVHRVLTIFGKLLRALQDAVEIFCCGEVDVFG